MTTPELLTTLRNTGCQLRTCGESLQIQGRLTDELRAAIREHKRELVALLAAQNDQRPITPPPPLSDITQPVRIWSDLLHAEVWYCPTQAQADALQQEGTAAYSLREYRMLQAMKARDPDGFPAKLTALHTLKTLYGATLTTVEAPGREEGSV